ncbi:hypothetical protein PCASD_13391 [Puccinia coronata f. sp. avenae]|uniref:Uncharacterized protein n=1 Tax=Puccinia coronata f. sp. avenae TaxID=200324 RepID=A0A2N5TZ64_9BASI|nr:hypothetical protein PCASD_13391 [Puccinia coronata f. sp. avenae]
MTGIMMQGGKGSTPEQVPALQQELSSITPEIAELTGSREQMMNCLVKLMAANMNPAFCYLVMIKEGGHLLPNLVKPVPNLTRGVKTPTGDMPLWGPAPADLVKFKPVQAIKQRVGEGTGTRLSSEVLPYFVVLLPIADCSRKLLQLFTMAHVNQNSLGAAELASSYGFIINRLCMPDHETALLFVAIFTSMISSANDKGELVSSTTCLRNWSIEILCLIVFRQWKQLTGPSLPGLHGILICPRDLPALVRIRQHLGKSHKPLPAESRVQTHMMPPQLLQLLVFALLCCTFLLTGPPDDITITIFDPHQTTASCAGGPAGSQGTAYFRLSRHQLLRFQLPMLTKHGKIADKDFCPPTSPR